MIQAGPGQVVGGVVRPPAQAQLILDKGCHSWLTSPRTLDKFLVCIAQPKIFKHHFPKIRHQTKTARVQNIINFEARALMKIHSNYQSVVSVLTNLGARHRFQDTRVSAAASQLSRGQAGVTGCG